MNTTCITQQPTRIHCQLIYTTVSLMAIRHLARMGKTLISFFLVPPDSSFCHFWFSCLLPPQWSQHLNPGGHTKTDITGWSFAFYPFFFPLLAFNGQQCPVVLQATVAPPPPPPSPSPPSRCTAHAQHKMTETSDNITHLQGAKTHANTCRQPAKPPAT